MAITFSEYGQWKTDELGELPGVLVLNASILA
jgi:hypothetical protein